MLTSKYLSIYVQDTFKNCMLHTAQCIICKGTWFRVKYHSKVLPFAQQSFLN